MHTWQAFRNSLPDGRSWRASHPLELVHSDLCGPMHTTSLEVIGIFSHLLMIIVGKHEFSFSMKNQKFLNILSASRLWLKGKVASH